jgi:hypothetical protein
MSKTGNSLDPARRAQLFELVDAKGERQVCELLGLSPKTVARAIAGLRLHNGNRLLICTFLGADPTMPAGAA